MSKINDGVIGERPVAKVRDGNAFAIIGACQKAARNSGWSNEKWESVRSEMTGGDYDNLLRVAMTYFDIEF